MNRHENEMEDVEMEAALRSFRQGVHAWSEQEFSQARTLPVRRPSRMWQLIANPAMGWALAAVLTVGGIGVPVGVHHERQVAAAQQAARQEQLRLAADAAEKQSAAVRSENVSQNASKSMSDEELLSHVDSDIAQAAPDAMGPLADMMSDSTAQ